MESPIMGFATLSPAFLAMLERMPPEHRERARANVESFRPDGMAAVMLHAKEIMAAQRREIDQGLVDAAKVSAAIRENAELEERLRRLVVSAHAILRDLRGREASTSGKP